MNDTLQSQFDDVSAQVKDNLAEQKLLDCLTGVKEAVQELGDAGLKISLDVRPRSDGNSIAPLPSEGVVLANGTIRLDDLDIRIALCGERSEKIFLKAAVGTSAMMTHKCYKGGDGVWRDGAHYEPDGTSLKDDLKKFLLRMKAENDIINSFDVAAKPAKPDVTTDSEVRVSGPLKLKTPGGR